MEFPERKISWCSSRIDKLERENIMSNTNKNEGRAYIMPKGTPANTEESPTLDGHVPTYSLEMNLLKEVNQKLDLLLTSLKISTKE